MTGVAAEKVARLDGGLILDVSGAKTEVVVETDVDLDDEDVAVDVDDTLRFGSDVGTAGEVTVDVDTVQVSSVGQD